MGRFRIDTISMSISLFLRFEGFSYRDVPPRVVSSGPMGAVTPPISVSSSPFSTATVFISWSLSQSTFPLFLDKNALSSRANHVVVVIIHFLIYVPPSSPPSLPQDGGVWVLVRSPDNTRFTRLSLATKYVLIFILVQSIDKVVDML